MINILVGGDICPMGKIHDSFIQGKSHEIFNDLLCDITDNDLSIANLECPLISKDTPITKIGKVFGSSDRCIAGFVAAKWDVLNLANNHSFDHGPTGLQETIQTIKAAGLSTVGAGMNMGEAQTPIVKTIKGHRIVVYSMAEREFSVADDRAPGANPLDLIRFVNAVRQHKQQGIFIVLIHGGSEFYQYPSPEMVRRCRFMVEMGADAIICCHSHCPLPWEIYAGRPIVYGLGNLIFEPTKEVKDTWYEGYLARLSIDMDTVRLETIPYFQSKTSIGAHKMDDSAQMHFHNAMNKANIQLKDSLFLEARWLEYCREIQDTYLSSLFPHHHPLFKLKHLLHPFMHSQKAILKALLLAECESHREILSTIFTDLKHLHNNNV